MTFDTVILVAGFFLIGMAAGFMSFLIIRMSMHAKKFHIAGALAVVTTLGGGGYLTYITKPVNFGLYAIGYFLGLLAYFFYICITHVPLSTSFRLHFDDSPARSAPEPKSTTNASESAVEKPTGEKPKGKRTTRVRPTDGPT
jgi:hypothetical protein